MSLQIPEVNLTPLLPILAVVITAIFVLAQDLLSRDRAGKGSYFLIFLGLSTAFYWNLRFWDEPGLRAFHGTFVLDRFALFFNAIILVACLATVVIARNDRGRSDYWNGEYLVLTLFATVGMMLMASANDLIVLFLGLETMSVAVYVLGGIRKHDERSNEAALKYFVLGAFASGFLLYGIALVYGAVGSTQIGSLSHAVVTGSFRSGPMLSAGIALLLVGFGFKVAAAPFHFWVPDVYEGAPTAVTTFMAVAVKAAAFSVFVRVFLDGLKGVSGDWAGIVWILAALTMTVANVIAIAQSNIKRMLAYSSIAHAGYLLVAITAGGEVGGTAALFYLLAYGVMNIGAFAVVLALGGTGKRNEQIQDFRGIGFRNPFLGLSMALFMFSLIGVPPFAGFTGKFYLFASAVKAGFVSLAVIGVLNSVLSAGYYLRIVVALYMQEGGVEADSLWTRPQLAATILFAAVGTVYLGLFPAQFLDLARTAFLSLYS